MKKILSLVVLLSFIVSCNKSSGDGNSICDETLEECVSTAQIVPDPDSNTPPVTDNTGLPNAAYTFESFIKFIQTTSSEQAKFDQAVEIIKKVVATEEFRTKVLDHTYSGKKTFVDNGGYTNSQIYQKILDAAEKLFPAKNNAIDMEVELYYANTNVIGYTYGTSKRIWVNTKYFGSNSVTSVAANLFHEWLHKVGFGHDASYSVSRDYSVPYAIGRMIGSIGKQFD